MTIVDCDHYVFYSTSCQQMNNHSLVCRPVYLMLVVILRRKIFFKNMHNNYVENLLSPLANFYHISEYMQKNLLSLLANFNHIFEQRYSAFIYCWLWKIMYNNTMWNVYSWWHHLYRHRRCAKWNFTSKSIM